MMNGYYIRDSFQLQFMRIILPILLLCSTFCLAQDDEFRDFRNKKDNFVKVSQKISGPIWPPSSWRVLMKALPNCP
ncbi:hypothetical protein [Paraflavitalea speifideaquila]|uniref:hypothetical protein n=1 Tax=Paraflavitalea speifideaquila TaxID=3076558 RepID=UPI0028F08191|nr:hypothetical protein [Paraflavitalea speifideiaquila]